MNADQDPIELGENRAFSLSSIDATNREFSLPPTDGGKDAWLFLLACFTLEGLVWGFVSSYGVFQEYYNTIEPFASSGKVTIIGACAMGILFIGIAFIFAFLKGLPRFRRWATLLGLLTMSLSLCLGSFATNVDHLILTQGILFALGGGFAWTPFLFFIEEWWVRRRGFAYGTAMAGAGLAGAISPLILEWLLHSYGFPITLRIWALALVILTLPIMLCFKPRLPHPRTSQGYSIDLSFWGCSTFLVFQASNLLQSIGYFVPTTYLPLFAKSLGASTWQSITTLVLLNGAAFVGSFCMGLAVDKYHVTTCLAVAALGSTVAVFGLWGLATSLAPLYAFCLIYGGFSGSASSSWSAVIRDTQRQVRSADSGMIFACLELGKGVANLCSGPLSEVLLHSQRWKAGVAYGGDYGALIVFVGVTAFLSGSGILARKCGLLV